MDSVLVAAVPNTFVKKNSRRRTQSTKMIEDGSLRSCCFGISHNDALGFGGEGGGVVLGRARRGGLTSCLS